MSHGTFVVLPLGRRITFPWTPAQDRRAGDESSAESTSSPSSSGSNQITVYQMMGFVALPGFGPTGARYAQRISRSPSGTRTGGGGSMASRLPWTRSNMADPRPRGRPPNSLEMDVDWHDLLPEQGDQTVLHEDENNNASSAISALEGQSQTNNLEAGRGTKAEAPLTARQRLEATGVQFHEEESWKEKVKEIAPRASCPYYVVTLTWLAHRE
ncbi:MAG: hypothetical protein Q9208_008570 [Pyrenodesmia sp. 3 TL-2023]